MAYNTVCRKPSNFSFVLWNVVVDIVRVRINTIRFIFFEADVRTFERSKSESLRDVSVTRIGNTFSYSFPQTEQKERLTICFEKLINDSSEHRTKVLYNIIR